MGRPSEFTPEAANEICERLAKGESLRSICADEESGWLPSERTVFRWLETNEAFRQQYAHAREVQAETLVDQIIDIADGKDKLDPKELEAQVASDTVVIRDHNRDRLRIESRKWVASKLAPKKYGEKVTTEHTGEGGGPITVAVKFV
jgi:hypothetical protein